ncbi:MAG: sugar ABC transporter permease [Arcanobacterium sp.]|nr:sugar ABC transporter permease [Arcanobacterium sp.]
MPYVFVGLPVLAILTFYIYPFLRTLVTSFTDTRPMERMGAFVGTSNYAYIFHDPAFWDAVLNSLIYAVCVVPLMVLLPLLLALLVRQYVPGIGAFRALYYVPAVCSLVVISLAWTSLLAYDGSINNLLMSLGVVDAPIRFLSSRWSVLFCAMIITLWQGLPYYMIMYLAALTNIDTSLYEAAEIDGAGAVRRFFTVTVRGVQRMMYLVGVLSLIGCLKVFTEVHLLGGSISPAKTITMYLREQTDVTYGHMGIGTAASVFLFVLTVGFMIASQRLDGEGK